jgi:hypothetical protein
LIKFLPERFFVTKGETKNPELKSGKHPSGVISSNVTVNAKYSKSEVNFKRLVNNTAASNDS